MNNIDQKLEKLKQLENLILHSKNDKRKALLIRDYIFLVSCLNDVGVLNYKDTIQNTNLELEQYYKYDLKEKFKTIDEYFDSMDIIINITDNLSKIYKKYPIINIKHSQHSYIKYDIGIKLLESFFKELGPVFYNIFKYTKENNTFDAKEYWGVYYYANSFTDKSSLVTIGYPHNEYVYFQGLAHEIGHCYEQQVLSNQRFYCNYNTGEVISTFIQKIFNYYIYSTTNLQDKALYDNMIRQTPMRNRFAKVKTGNKILLSGYLNGIDIEDYTLKWNTPFISKPITFSDYLYLLDEVIAFNLVKLYIDNPKEGLKELKNFITTNHAYSFRERLIEYGSVDGVTLSIKNAHEYQKSHHYYKNK